MLKLHETLSHALFQAFVLYRDDNQALIPKPQANIASEDDGVK
jgi:hypothetical protein